jgi:Fe2+ transport system protein FeoA
MRSLFNVEENVNVVIEVLKLEKGIKHKLISMGVRPNAAFKVVNKKKNGSLIIANSSFTIALDKQLASNIYIKLAG